MRDAMSAQTREPRQHPRTKNILLFGEARVIPMAGRAIGQFQRSLAPIPSINAGALVEGALTDGIACGGNPRRRHRTPRAFY